MVFVWVYAVWGRFSGPLEADFCSRLVLVRVLAMNPLSLHAPLGLGLRGEQEREFFVPIFCWLCCVFGAPPGVLLGFLLTVHSLVVECCRIPPRFSKQQKLRTGRLKNSLSCSPRRPRPSGACRERGFLASTRRIRI